MSVILKVCVCCVIFLSCGRFVSAQDTVIADPCGDSAVESSVWAAISGQVVKVEDGDTITISVKGKTETTRVFELMAPAGQLPEELARLRECFEQAQRAYLAQEWDPAEAAFRECLQIRSNDGPSRVFLERIQILRRNSPGKDWNGVWQLVEK